MPENIVWIYRRRHDLHIAFVCLDGIKYLQYACMCCKYYIQLSDLTETHATLNVDRKHPPNAIAFFICRENEAHWNCYEYKFPQVNSALFASTPSFCLLSKQEQTIYPLHGGISRVLLLFGYILWYYGNKHQQPNTYV